MDRIFGDVFGAHGGQGEDDRPRGLRVYMPVNLRETSDSYEVEAPVPGFGPEDIDVTFSDGLLTIKAERQEQRDEQGQYLRREFLRASSSRQLALSGEIDPEKIQADVENGLLTVRVPKAAVAQPRRIPISSSRGDTKKLVG
jgi:HSP20 family protein